MGGKNREENERNGAPNWLNSLLLFWFFPVILFSPISGGGVKQLIWFKRGRESESFEWVPLPGTSKRVLCLELNPHCRRGLKPGPRRTASSVVGIHSCVVVTTEIVLSREICTWQSQNGTWSFLFSALLSSRCTCVGLCGCVGVSSSKL